MKRSLKLVIIGAGSPYTPELFAGLIDRYSTLPIRELMLVDLPEGMEKARVILDFGIRMFRKAGIDVRMELTENRRKALQNADFVISQIRVGGIPARILDETIGLNNGIIGQETTGAGGFMNAMRTIPVALAIARDMEELCPNAWLVNFTNPAGIVTEAVRKHTKVSCIGLCNVPVNMLADASRMLGVDTKELHCSFVGLNHLSYIVKATHAGRAVLPEIVEKIDGNETLMKNIPKVEGVGALIRTIGIIPSPYLQYYYFEEAMLAKQQKEYRDAGVTRGAIVQKIDEALFDRYRDPALEQNPPELAQRGGSLYSYAALNAIEALCSPQPIEMVLNYTNGLSVPGLLPDDVVETNCLVSSEGVSPVQTAGLPHAAQGLVQTVKHYERLTIEAAVSGHREMAVWALLNHPLIHGYQRAAALVDEMERAFPSYIHLHGAF